MKLYNVSITYDIVVRAEDESNAISEAIYAISDCDEPDECDVSIIESVEDLIPPWDGECRPYGKADDWDRTIRELLKSQTTEEVSK